MPQLLQALPFSRDRPGLLGKPEGHGELRFSDQILDRLIFQAAQRVERQPALGLYVDERNTRAIRVYERAGFRSWSLRRLRTGRPGVYYRSYVLDLSRLRVAPSHGDTSPAS